MSETARLLDHIGGWTPPFPVGTCTCGRGDRYTHRLFAASQVHPGDNLFQALTLCGHRALEIPGRGETDCPECLEAIAEDSPQ